MSTTNDIYNDAIKGSTLHSKEYANQRESSSLKVFTVLLIGCTAYAGFYFYNLKISKKEVIDTRLVVKTQSIKKVDSRIAVIEKSSEKSSDESDYLMALRGIESELSGDRETVNLNTSDQLNLSLAMGSLTEDTKVADDSSYTEKLKNEIGIVSQKKVVNINIKEVEKREDPIKAHKVIVKKGDTLEQISNDFYGDAKNYKIIVASNDSVDSSDLIYEGQTIILPY